MTKKLTLAVDIADETKAGDQESGPLDIKAMAKKLRKAHPTADASVEEIEGALRVASETPTKG